jgi:MFS family permease
VTRLTLSEKIVRSLFDNLRRLPAAAWILFAGTFVNRFGSFVMPFLVLYLTRIGYTGAQAGVALGAYGFGHIVASMLGGHLADRIGRRNTIALSMFTSATAMLALSQARGYPLILVLTTLAGLTTELYRPASYALVSDLVEPEQRVAAFGMYRFAVNVGFACGPATAGFLADRSFFLLFAGDAITSVVFGIIALAFLPHGLRALTHDEKMGEALRYAAHDRRFILFLLATVCLTPIDFQMGSTYALHIRAQGLPMSTFGMLISLNGLLIVLFELAITAWTQQMRPEPAIAAGYLLSGLGFALSGLAHRVPLLALTMSIWTLGEMVSSPVAGSYVAQLAPERYRGRYMGLLMLAWSLGLMFGPPLGTFVYEHNPPLLWIGAGALSVVSALLALASGETRSADVSSARA